MVNGQTHTYTEVYPARLAGWRRDWRHWVDGPTRKATALTIEPCDRTVVAGMIARVPAEAWEALVAREAGYRTVAIEASRIAHSGPDDARVFTFQSMSSRRGSAEHPIPQSYVDCVMKGFLDNFGASSLQGFIDTTDGWEVPIHRDRHAPTYPRAVALSKDEIDLFDGMLRENGATWL